ncbi:Inorganic polyphosphate/ATP-NAD kinase [Haloferax elongans ATCC BAA-1513]|uniref:NAD kinase n=1 Tax=Haloferax elongans ATCC BAA-1513 TaxID=1230453 RepID=M0HFQ7_HALEO|nr:NAD(+)/NADH kinase [Haloferax elongans]ELZ82618.1 Inorganic polyphosphate/ATP-NAD kinase [Haloferax elongans ATCC BAA-1513]
MNVGIVAQKGNSRAAYLAADMREALAAVDAEALVDDATAEQLGIDGLPVEEFADCDLVVSIGGDGTFLYAARGGDGVPILGVNLGEVGFLNAVSPDDAIDAVLDVVEQIRADEPAIREVPRIVARGDDWELDPAMNEVVVHGPRRGHGGGAGIEVRVDGSLYSGGHADGVLVSTPAGSTAYNLSESGPLVHPGVEGLVVTEMAASEGMPSLVVPLDATVTVTVTDAEEAIVVGDGRTRRTVEPPIEVTIEQSDSPVRLAGPTSDFFEALGKLD